MGCDGPGGRKWVQSGKFMGFVARGGGADVGRGAGVASPVMPPRR